MSTGTASLGHTKSAQTAACQSTVTIAILLSQTTVTVAVATLVVVAALTSPL